MRRPTSTSAFGVSKRESHDSADFYRRFTPPRLSAESEVAAGRSLDKLVVGDARHMKEVADSSVALVVTSPPYFAGKEYEESLGQGGVPGSYLEYLQLLREVLAESVRKLEPGGRLAVNVANLGRRPYRSLSADVIGILQDDLRLLLRGEIVWVKQRGSSGSCAWGSFQRPGNPVLRDLTERVVVASKGRFDRALPPRARVGLGLPFESSMTRDDFMEHTLDVWEIPPERATRVGHPAPFPVELPARLIELYTYRGDLVLDPFIGSGTTAVAAVRSGRRYVGYDQEKAYVALAEARVAQERARPGGPAGGVGGRLGLPAGPEPAEPERGPLARALREGWSAKDVGRALVSAAGFEQAGPGRPGPGGVAPDLSAVDARGRTWSFDVAGPFTTHRPGLARADALWKAVARAAVMAEGGGPPLVVLTAGVPGPGSAGAAALDQVTGPGRPIRAVVGMLDPTGLDSLRALYRDP